MGIDPQHFSRVALQVALMDVEVAARGKRRQQYGIGLLLERQVLGNGPRARWPIVGFILSAAAERSEGRSYRSLAQRIAGGCGGGSAMTVVAERARDQKHHERENRACRLCFSITL